jgi:hypothetical protein
MRSCLSLLADEHAVAPALSPIIVISVVNFVMIVVSGPYASANYPTNTLPRYLKATIVVPTRPVIGQSI